MGHVKYQLIGFWCSDSNLRPFFLISDDPGGRYLQILMTSGSPNMKSMKISHVRYQIIGILVCQFNSKTSDDPGGSSYL